MEVEKKSTRFESIGVHFSAFFSQKSEIVLRRKHQDQKWSEQKSVKIRKCQNRWMSK